MISQKIENMIEEALHKVAAEDLHPTKAVVQVVGESSDELTPEMVDRVVQGLNTRMIVSQVKKQKDLENECCIASPEEIKGTVVLKELKEKKAGLVGRDEFHYEAPRDYFQEKKANLDFSLEFELDEAKYNPSGYVWEATKLEEHNDAEEQLQKRASANLQVDVEEEWGKLKKYLEKFSSYKSNDEQFVEEMRFLFPKSGILKIAGLSEGSKRMPDHHTTDHKEFLEAEKVLQRFKFIKSAAGSRERAQAEMAAQQAALRKIKMQQRMEQAAALGGAAMQIPKKGWGAAKILTDPFMGPARSVGKALLSPFSLGSALHMASTVPNNPLDRFGRYRTQTQKAKDGAKIAIDTIERRAVFDALMQDPEFKGADQDKMLQLFRDVNSVAPVFGKVPATVRSIMRAANAADNYDLSPELTKSLISAEKAFRARPSDLYMLEGI